MPGSWVEVRLAEMRKVGRSTCGLGSAGVSLENLKSEIPSGDVRWLMILEVQSYLASHRFGSHN